MLSVTGYFKYLDSPIERIQDLQGGATLHSFKNADNGMAAGVELEMRKRLVKDLRLGTNISYMYTNVKLPQSGAYTNKERSLQGASPILANADLTYSPRFGEDRQLNPRPALQPARQPHPCSRRVGSGRCHATDAAHVELQRRI